MAEDIIIRYRAEVDELKGQLDFMIKQNEELGDSAASTSDILKQEAKVQAKANEARIAQIKELKKQLESLERARKAAFEPAEIADYDKQIKQVTKDIQTLKNGTTNVKKGNDVLTKSFKGIGASIAAAFTVDAVIRFANQSIEAFQEAEEAAKRLDFTIRNIGGEGESEIEALNEQARELSQNFRSVFSTQDIQKLQTQLSQYGLLTDQIEDLTPAILDLASAQGVTLEKAASDVIQAIEGQGRALKQVGIVVDSNQTTFERYEDVLEGLGKFTGAAAEETQTYAGELKNLEKDIENISVRIGETIAPAFQRVKVAAFEAAEGIIDLFTVTGRNFQAFKTVGTGLVENTREVSLTLAELGFQASGSQEQIANLVQIVGRNVTELDKDTAAGIANAKSTEDLLKVKDKIIENYNTVRGLAKAELITTENQVVLNQIYAEQLNKVKDAIKQFGAETNNLLDSQQLNKLSTQELIKLLEEYGKKTDVISRSNVEAINKELDKREKTAKEIAKIEEERRRAALKFIEQQKKLDDEATQDEIDNDKRVTEELIRELEKRTKETQEFFDKEARASEIRARDVVASSAEGLGTRDRIKNARGLIGLTEEDRKAELNKLKSDFDAGLITEADYLIQREEIITKYANRRASLLEQLGVTEADLIRSNAEIWITENQVILDSTVNLVNQLQSLFSGFFDTRLENLNRESEAYQEQLSKQQEALEESRNQRLITESEYQEGIAELNKKEEESRRKLAEEQAKIAKRQALFEKISALTTIAIETAQAIAEIQLRAAVLATTPIIGPALKAQALAQIPFILGFAAAQSATIAAQPLPQFAKGTKGKKDSGMAIVGEEGPEMTFLPKGSKVLPAKQTRTYSQAFDAMYDGTFDKYIDTEYEKRNSDRLIQSITRHKEVIKTEYITPVLQEQKRKYEQVQSERFADNVAHSITVSNSGLYWDLENIRKKGQRVVNADDIGRAVAKEVGKVIQSRRRQ